MFNSLSSPASAVFHSTGGFAGPSFPVIEKREGNFLCRSLNLPYPGQERAACYVKLALSARQKTAAVNIVRKGGIMVKNVLPNFAFKPSWAEKALVEESNRIICYAYFRELDGKSLEDSECYQHLDIPVVSPDLFLR